MHAQHDDGCSPHACLPLMPTAAHGQDIIARIGPPSLAYDVSDALPASRVG